jgi:predicted ATPase
MMLENLIVGREKEKAMISRCLQKAINSNGQTILINGEAGIGKSTLVDFLRFHAESMGMTVCMGDTTILDISTPYLPFQRAFDKIIDEDIFQNEEFTHFDEIFLISKIGLLISHVSRSKDEGLDEDILGSMLTAVQDFVKDSFGGAGSETQKGGLGKLEYMNTKIFIEHGDLVYMAVVTSGEEHPYMKQEIRSCLAEIEARYFDILADWDGDIDALSGTLEIMNKTIGKHFRIKRSLENINLDTERLKMQDKILEFITKKAEKGILLVLEDVHWADTSTMLALPYLARNITDSKLLLCITFRPDDLDKHDTGHKKILEILSSDSAFSTTITLDSIDDTSLKNIVVNTLGGGHPPDELLASLGKEADGNPFFIIEAVRALISDGTLYKDDDVWVLKHGPKSALPHSVSDLVSRRLETLDLDCLRIIEYGAVLGRRFDRSMIASGFSLESAKLNQIIESLTELNIFTQLQGDELMFEHSKTQEVIYSGLSERWRKALHRNAGIVTETRNQGNLDNVLFNLAYHFSNAQDYDKGIEYSISAGYKASNNLAPRESIQFFEQATNLIILSGRTDDRYPEILEFLGELYELDGNYTSALASYTNVLELSPSMPTTAKILMKKGRVFQAQSDYENAISTFEQGISLAQESGFNFWKAKINGYLGKIFLRKGQYELALELQRDYLKESQIAGVAREIGQAYMNLGGVYWFMNNHLMAIKHWEEALTIFKALKYLQGIANVNDNLGVGYSSLGQFEKSLEHYKSSEQIMAKIGDVKGTSMVLLNIGVLYDRMGNHVHSLEYYRRSLQIKKKIADFIGAANIYNNIGGAYFDMGHYEEAAENMTLNLELMKKYNDTWGISQALINLADVKIEMNQLDEAQVLCGLSLEMAKKHDFKEILSSNLRAMGVFASTNNEYDKADSYFNESLCMAKEIKDPQRIGMTYLSMAKSFLKRGEKEKALDCFSLAIKTFEESRMGTFARKARQEMQKIVDPN